MHAANARIEQDLEILNRNRGQEGVLAILRIIDLHYEIAKEGAVGAPAALRDSILGGALQLKKLHSDLTKERKQRTDG